MGVWLLERDVRLSGLAENPALPTALLDQLIATAGLDLKLDLAQRGDLSPAQARALLDSGDGSVVAALLESGAIAPGDVPTEDDRLAVVVAARPGADPDLVRRVAAHPDPEVRARLAERGEGLPADVVAALVRDPVVEVARDAAACQPLTAELAAELLAHPSADLRKALSCNGSTPPEVLLALVAAREDLPDDLLEAFAEDGDVVVVKAVIANPALPEDRLRALADRHGPRLHQRLAHNPNCPPDLLDRMARDPETPRKAYRAIAAHPNAGPETLLRCLSDERAAEEAASHPNLPASAFPVLLADDAPWNALSRAAANPVLPVELMTELLNPAQPACVER